VIFSSKYVALQTYKLPVANKNTKRTVEFLHFRFDALRRAGIQKERTDFYSFL
jgi:hypothetical protein